AHAPQVIPVGHGGEGPVQGQDLQAVARQVQLADDLGPQQRDHVRADREVEAGEDLLGDRGATHDVPALQDQDLLAGAREVRRVDEAVVPGPDDDRVVARAHRRILWAVPGPPQGSAY